jgi:hypothetical protein
MLSHELIAWCLSILALLTSLSLRPAGIGACTNADRLGERARAMPAPKDWNAPEEVEAAPKVVLTVFGDMAGGGDEGLARISLLRLLREGCGASEA